MPKLALQTVIRCSDVIDWVAASVVREKTDDLFVFVNEGEEIIHVCGFFFAVWMWNLHRSSGFSSTASPAGQRQAGQIWRGTEIKRQMLLFTHILIYIFIQHVQRENMADKTAIHRIFWGGCLSSPLSCILHCRFSRKMMLYLLESY